MKIPLLTTAAFALAILIAQSTPAQDTPAADKPLPEVREKPEASKGIPPRAAPTDYQTHAQVGKLTLAAELDGHSFPDPSLGIYNNDYVFVEVAFYGAPGASLALNYQDFSLRINGKKNLYPAQPYSFTFKSLLSPEYEPPTQHMLDEADKKTSVNTGTNGKSPISTTNITDPKLPPIVHVPFEVKRGWEQKVHMASLPEGERALPQGGVLYFEKDGKTNSVELIYNGPAGKATIRLQ